VDQVAADQFCRDLWPRLAAAMGLLAGDPSAGEDIAQETLARVWAPWDHVSGLDAPEAWAYRVAVNLSRSRYRRLAAERRALARVGAVDVPGGPDAADALAIRAAVSALPQRQRAALVLRYFADLPVVAVAEILRCAPGTVKSLTSQAIEHLRIDFAVDDDEEAADE
jgi:DNA-directed RNA polymerase specialized sigma24 family protein